MFLDITLFVQLDEMKYNLGMGVLHKTKIICITLMGVMHM
jgi:hypothetical protein